jgi:MFS transporter, Spinster family, sphingosine-1-phosphate transporter
VAPPDHRQPHRGWVIALLRARARTPSTGADVGARRVFGLLFVLMMIDFADRQVLVGAFPDLRREWGLTESELGALVSVLTLAVGLAAVPVAAWVDRRGRVRAIALMGVVWSAAAAASGWTQGYLQLLVARVGVGAGEAGYGPAGGALLAARSPGHRRATVLGAFYSAGPLGAVVGTALGGAIAAEWGWRWAVGVLAVPGLLVALAVLRVRDYATVRPERSASRPAAIALLRARSAVGAIAGAVLLLIVASALYTWLPTYLQGAYHVGPAHASALAAGVLIAGAAGTTGTAVAADRLARRDPRMRLRVPALAALATAGLLGPGFGVVPAGGAQLALLLAGVAMMTSAVGPVAAVVIDVVHPGQRATAASGLVVAQNLLGLTIGPVLTGFLADRLGLVPALALVPLLGLVAAVTLWLGARSYPGDRVEETPRAAAITSGTRAPG